MFWCDNEPTTTEEFSWRVPGKSYTKGYQEHVLRSLINSTVEDVCMKEGLGAKQVGQCYQGLFLAKSL